MTGTFALNTAGLPSLVDAEGASDDNAPVDALDDSSRTLTVGAANSKVKATTVAHGGDAEAVTLAIVDPEADSASLSVSVTGKAITVSAATDSDGVITSTAANVISAINGDTDASALVTAANGTGSNGSGVVAPVAATHVTGVAPLTVSDTTLQAFLRTQQFNGVPVWIES